MVSSQILLMDLPNLKGVATKDLVEHIGSGSFKASYINWSRTMQLFRDNAPGWMVEMIFNADGTPLHRAPVGGFILLRLRHTDGTITPEVPQAVMDNRNNSIPFDKITSRDVTDTHRRGTCLALAFLTGLGGELWAKMPLESGYQVADEAEIKIAKRAASKGATEAAESVKQATESDFLGKCSEMGLTDAAAKSLLPKVKGDFAAGIKTLAEKDQSFIETMNAKFPDTPGEDF